MDDAQMGAASGTEVQSHELGGSERRMRNPQLPRLNTWRSPVTSTRAALVKRKRELR